MRMFQISTAVAALAAFSTAACAEATDADAAAGSATTEAVTVQDASVSTPATEPAEPAPNPAETALAAVIETAPDSAWRTVDPENLLKITTGEGVVWVELAADIAPVHSGRMRELARMDWFDYKVWHRVIDGFMAQGGGALDNPSIAPPTDPIGPEFTIRRDPAQIVITEIQERPINPRSNRSRAQAGFWNGFPAGTQPAAAAGIMGDGRVDSWLIHCDGAAAMARTSDPNSANAQFYIVRGSAEHLNTDYTVWGKVRAGLDVVYALEEGTLGQDGGFRPSFIEDIQVVADLPADERRAFQVMDTQSAAFAGYVQALTDALGSAPDVCNITVPVRTPD